MCWKGWELQETENTEGKEMNQAEAKRRQVQVISYIFAWIILAIIAKLTGYSGVTYVAAGLEVYAIILI